MLGTSSPPPRERVPSGKRTFNLLAPIVVSLLLLAAVAVSLHLVLPRTSGAKPRDHRPTTTLTPPTAIASASLPDRPPSSATDCAGKPGSGTPDYASLRACGFPSPDTTGVPRGTTLTPYTGPSNITTAGTTIRDAEITQNLTISASNVTIEDSDINIANLSTGAIRIGPGVTGTLIAYDSIHGTSATQAGNLQAGVWNANPADGANAVTIDHVDFYDGQRILHGSGTLQNSFCLNNVAVSGAHQECVYEGGGSITITHNTLLTAHDQTAAIFMAPDFGPLGTVNVINNLLAGGAYTLYGGATADGTGVSSETVTGNRFSRLYFSDGGKWGPDAYMPKTYTWSGNVWDDTRDRVSP